MDKENLFKAAVSYSFSIGKKSESSIFGNRFCSSFWPREEPLNFFFPHRFVIFFFNIDLNIQSVWKKPMYLCFSINISSSNDSDVPMWWRDNKVGQTLFREKKTTLIRFVVLKCRTQINVLHTFFFWWPVKVLGLENLEIPVMMFT